MKTKFNPIETSLLRDLVTEAFSDDDFTVFCYDNFREVYDSWTAGIGRTLKVHMLIEYCERHGTTEELLRLIQSENPYQYAVYQERKQQAINVSSNSQNQHGVEQKILSIRLEGDFSNLSQNQLDLLVTALVSALAAATMCSPEEFQVMEAKTGSLTVKIRLPSDIAVELLGMYSSSSVLLKDLGIDNIQDPEKDDLAILNELLDSLEKRATSTDEVLKVTLDKVKEIVVDIDMQRSLVFHLASTLRGTSGALEELKYIHDLTEKTKEYLESRLETAEVSIKELQLIHSILGSIEAGEEKLHKWPWPLGLGIRKE